MTRTLAAALGLAVLGLVLFARNWAGWADPLVDFGRELYVPWQLGEGRALYRDIAYLDGPFSPHLNTLVFAAAGTSLRSLELANLAVLALAAASIFALIRRLGDALTACAAVGFFLGVFAFNAIGTGGNMNWIAPYSHGVTHGVTLALVAFWSLARYFERGRIAELAGAGLALGLVLLTKPEVFAASALGIGVAIASAARHAPTAGAASGRRLVVLGGTTLAPLLLAVSALACAMPLREAFASALGGWPHVLGSSAPSLHFYRWVMGIDDTAANLAQMAAWTGAWVLALAPALASARWLPRDSGAGRGLAIGLPLAILALAFLYIGRAPWGEALRPLALFLTAFAALAARDVSRAERPEERARASLQLGLACFALALLGKVLLKPILVGYAFALAAPAAMLLVLALTHSLPAAISRRGGDGRVVRLASLAVLSSVALGCWWHSEALQSTKTIDVARGADRIRAGQTQRAPLAARLVRWVDETLPADATLVVMPEGASINYLTRRANPTRHLVFLPPELAIFGEDRILADLRAAPPDYIALVQRDTPEYGLPLFGRDYGRELLGWARADYDVAARVGAPPLQPARLEDRRPGFEILRRR